MPRTKYLFKNLIFIYRLEVTKVKLPVPPSLDAEANTVVDSVVMLRDDTLAIKCALHVNIYVASVQMLVDRKRKTSDGLV